MEAIGGDYIEEQSSVSPILCLRSESALIVEHFWWLLHSWGSNQRLICG